LQTRLFTGGLLLFGFTLQLLLTSQLGFARFLCTARRFPSALFFGATGQLGLSGNFSFQAGDQISQPFVITLQVGSLTALAFQLGADVSHHLGSFFFLLFQSFLLSRGLLGQLL